jgi:hypothetical protein
MDQSLPPMWIRDETLFVQALHERDIDALAARSFSNSCAHQSEHSSSTFESSYFISARSIWIERQLSP